MFDIQEELKKLPAKPGVYIMHDDETGHYPEKSSQTVFSEQQKSYAEDSSDGQPCGAF